MGRILATSRRSSCPVRTWALQLEYMLTQLHTSDQRWYKFTGMGPDPSPRSGHAMAAYGNRVIVLGGQAYSGTSDDPSLVHVLDTSEGDDLPESSHANDTYRAHQVSRLQPKDAERIGDPQVDLWADIPPAVSPADADRHSDECCVTATRQRPQRATFVSGAWREFL
jgi:hypothetical protein